MAKQKLSNYNSKPKQTENDVNFDKDFAQFSKHTTGFGIKMLQKFGFKGRLGKNETGRINPILPTVRKGKKQAGLDFKGAPSTAHTKRGVKVEAKPVRQIDDFLLSSQSAWKKGSQRRRPRSVSEILTAVRRNGGSGENQIIHDFTKNSENNFESPADETFHPEIRENIQKIVDWIEQSIVANDETKSRLVLAQKDLAEKLSRVEAKKAAIRERRERLKALSALIRAARAATGRLETASAAEAFAALERAVAAFEEIRASYAPEFDHLRLANVFFAAMGEGFSGVFFSAGFEGAAWLESPEKITNLFKRLRYLLSNDDVQYARLMSRFTAGRLARFVDAEWDPASHAQTRRFAVFLAEFKSALPPEMAAALLSETVAPKLARAAFGWDFSVDAEEILAAVEGWALVLGGEEGDKLIQNVAHKLSLFIETQSLFDEAQYGLIARLKKTAAQTANGLVKDAVLPKLAAALEAFDLNPSRSDFKLMALLKKWPSVFCVPETVTVFEKHFFSRWLTIAHVWVTKSNSEKAALMNDLRLWYLAWKTHFPSFLLTSARFQQNLLSALDLFNCVFLDAVPAVPPLNHFLALNDARLVEFEARQAKTKNSQRAEPPAVDVNKSKMASFKLDLNKSHGPSRLSFKEAVAAFAAERNLDFFPSGAQPVGGKTVFSFGRKQVYLDAGCVFAKAGETWVPVTLESLV